MSVVLCKCGSLNTIKFDDSDITCIDCGWESHSLQTTGGSFVAPSYIVATYAPYKQYGAQTVPFTPQNVSAVLRGAMTPNEVRAQAGLAPVVGNTTGVHWPDGRCADPDCLQCELGDLRR